MEKISIEQARPLQYVTGHSRGGGLPADLDWQRFADQATTTAIYMPTRTLAALVAKAVEQGPEPATPAIAIASWCDDDLVSAIRFITFHQKTLSGGSPNGERDADTPETTRGQDPRA